MLQTLDLESILKTERVTEIECNASNDSLRQIVSDNSMNDAIFLLQYLLLGTFYPNFPVDAHRPTFGYICLNQTLLLTFRHLVPTNCLVFDDSGVIIGGYSMHEYLPTGSSLHIRDILKELNYAKDK